MAASVPVGVGRHPLVVARSRLLPSVERRLLIDGREVVIRRGRGNPVFSVVDDGPIVGSAPS